MALQNGFPGHTALASFADLRRDLEGTVVRSAAGVLRAGVFPDHLDPLVTGRTDMKVNIADFRAVQNRGGAIFLANVGVDSSVTLDAAPASNKRIDLIYAHQRSVTLGDAASTPVFGVVKGTASATPTVPPLPAGVSTAIPLATVEIPAGATTTLSAGVVFTQVYPYTAMAGGTVFVRSTAELAGWLPANGAVAHCVADSRKYVRTGGAWVDGSSRRAVTIATDRSAFPTGFIDTFNMSVMSGETTDSSIISTPPATGNKVTILESGFYSVTWFANFGANVSASSPIAFNRGATTLIHQANCTNGQSAVTLAVPDVYFTAGEDLTFYANKVAGGTFNFTGKLVIAKAR